MTAVRHIERRANRLPAPVDAVVQLTRREFENLLEYSCSLPTGTTIGKRWRCNRNAFRWVERAGIKVPYDGPADWWLGEYYEINVPDRVGIRWSRIEVVG